MMNLRFLGAADLVWPMSAAAPYYRCGTGNYGGRSFEVDPHPGYAHDSKLVEMLVRACEHKFPLHGVRAELCTLEHEFVGRTNGLAFEDNIWKRDDGASWEETFRGPDGVDVKSYGQGHCIVLCGKRIPPMPSTTRYVVTHEFGHVAFNHTRRLLGYKESEDDRLEAEYLRIRGVEPSRRKGDGERWHRLASEIIANDFRCIVMHTEIEFWPHEVEQLDEASAIGEWWKAAIARAHAYEGLK
jgi:hypothetical protein